MKSESMEWWQSLPATERFYFMKKHEVKQVSDKLIERMYSKEFLNII